MKGKIWASALFLFIAACSTSPLGRKQLLLLPEGQMDALGAQAFQQTKQETPVDHDPKINAYVQCVTKPIAAVASEQTSAKDWEIVTFKDDKTVNAFALPGGKIGVYSGLLQVANTPGQLAAVLGHEVGHVIAHHGDERMSQGLAEQIGLAGASILTSGSPYSNDIMAALGLGTQVGVALPFSRTQESEADLIGVDLMAKAGFDPHDAVHLWENMIKHGGQQPPELLSDHPADQKRVENVSARVPEAMPIYEKAVSEGRHPQCTAP